MGALACGAIGVASIYAAYNCKEDGTAYWLLAVFAIIGAACS